MESAFTPLEFQGVTWALMAEVDTNEALAGVTTLRNVAALITLVVAIVVGLAGVFVSRKLITQPIGSMVSAMGKLAGGDRVRRTLWKS
ncbi:MAG: hypothetical protein COA75_07565 [Cellvibrionales bacterium]|nr:MAG: hypothetical protein COA75_07565 [Cellvibrionales bacterium]